MLNSLSLIRNNFESFPKLLLQIDSDKLIVLIISNFNHSF